MPTFDAGLTALVGGRGPGRLIIIAGGLMTVWGFAGWMMIIFNVFDSGFDIGGGFPGGRFPSGMVRAVVYFAAFGGGGLVAGAGKALAEPEDPGRGARFGTWVTFFATCTLLTFAVLRVLDGAPLAELNPIHSSSSSAGKPAAAGTRSQSGSVGVVTTGAKPTTHAVMLRRDPNYGLIFEPSSLHIAVDNIINITNSTRVSCRLQPIDGELPSQARGMSTVPASGHLDITWNSKGLWSLRCRGTSSSLVITVT